jgi:uncharacterized membrane protein
MSLAADCMCTAAAAAAAAAAATATGNQVSAGAFAVALLGDLLDVAAHVVVVVGLLHTHFQVRLRLKCFMVGFPGRKCGRHHAWGVP